MPLLTDPTVALPTLAATDWLAFFGRFHPLFLHLPIGLLGGLAALEFTAWWRARSKRIAAAAKAGDGKRAEVEWQEEARHFVGIAAWLAAASGVIAVVTGLLLSREEAYEAGSTLNLHMWTGIGVGAGAVLAAVIHQVAVRQRRHNLLVAFRAILLVTLGLLVPAGHIGGNMSHGETFLSEHAPDWLKPLIGKAPTKKTPGPDNVKPAAFAEVVLPIMEARCVSCHSGTKKKGGLDLSTVEGWKKGGANGATFVAGKPEESLLLQRIHLPLDDEEHMAPKGKPQCSEGEVAALTWWIKAGASFESPVPADAPAEVLAIAKTKPTVPAVVPVETPPAAAPGIKPADLAAVAALRAIQVAIQPVAQGDNRLVVDYAGAAQRTTDAEVKLAAPLAVQTTELKLSRSKVTDQGLATLQPFVNLEILDLSGTQVGNAGLEALTGLKKLEVVNLSNTKVSDAGLETLAKIASLKKVYLWGSGASADGVAKFRAAHPKLAVDFGDTPPAAAIVPKIVNAVCPITGKPADPNINTDVGGQLIGFATPEAKKQFDDALKGEAPAAAPAPAPAAKAVNTTCPVAGKPVNPAFVSTFEGKTVAFCCGSCKKQFDANPASFKDKIK